MNIEIKQPRVMARPQFNHLVDLWLPKSRYSYERAIHIARQRAADRGCRQVVQTSYAKAWVVQDVR